MTALLPGCGLIFPSDKLRQKIIVEVETPSDLRSGSSVVETKVVEGKSWGDSSGTRFQLSGEAVAVDMPGGKRLFALLRGRRNEDQAGYQTRLLMDALRAGVRSNPPISIDGRTLMQVRALASNVELQLDLPSILYPMLVIFRDPSDPKSVEPIEANDLARHFGSGVRLKRIILAVTDEPITRGIMKKLPSFGKETGFDNWFRTLPYGDPRAITISDFSQGTDA